MADTKVLEAFAVRCAGSSPVPSTKPVYKPRSRHGHDFGGAGGGAGGRSLNMRVLLPPVGWAA
jgi:hypothetical protein